MPLYVVIMSNEDDEAIATSALGADETNAEVLALKVAASTQDFIGTHLASHRVPDQQVLDAAAELEADRMLWARSMKDL